MYWGLGGHIELNLAHHGSDGGVPGLGAVAFSGMVGKQLYLKIVGIGGSGGYRRVDSSRGRGKED